eukprot:jgi/Botrbrau1/11538/Bobra.0393s0016.2
MSATFASLLSAPAHVTSLRRLRSKKAYARRRFFDINLRAVYRWAPGVDGSRKRESLLDNGEDASSSMEPSRYADRQSPQDVVDADWTAAGKGDGLESWPLEDLDVYFDDAQAERRNRADTAGPSNGQPRGKSGAERPTDTFWGLPEPETQGYGSGQPPEGFSMEDWQRVRAEIESDWGPGTWQPTGGNAWTDGPLAGREVGGGLNSEAGRGIPLQGGVGPPPPIREIPPPAAVYEDWEDPDPASDAVWPDITLLLPLEVEQVLSITPSSDQVRFFLSDVTVLVQNIGISILATALLFKVPAATAATLTFPIWWPLLRAANRNRSVRASARSPLFLSGPPAIPCPSW